MQLSAGRCRLRSPLQFHTERTAEQTSWRPKSSHSRCTAGACAWRLRVVILVVGKCSSAQQRSWGERTTQGCCRRPIAIFWPVSDAACCRFRGSGSCHGPDLACLSKADEKGVRTIDCRKTNLDDQSASTESESSSTRDSDAILAETLIACTLFSASAAAGRAEAILRGHVPSSPERTDTNTGTGCEAARASDRAASATAQHSEVRKLWTQVRILQKEYGHPLRTASEHFALSEAG